MSFSPDESTLLNFKRKYGDVHPLVFQRSLEKAVSSLDLFEILESIPSSPPFSWDEASRSWRRDEDVMASDQMKSMLKKRR